MSPTRGDEVSIAERKDYLLPFFPCLFPRVGLSYHRSQLSPQRGAPCLANHRRIALLVRSDVITTKKFWFFTSHTYFQRRIETFLINLKFNALFAILDEEKKDTVTSSLRKSFDSLPRTLISKEEKKLV